jgi:calmodulin
MARAQLTKAQLTGIRNVFSTFDRNGDGTVSVTEIGDVMKKLGRYLSDEELKEKVALMDKNGSGKVEFDEFVEVKYFTSYF